MVIHGDLCNCTFMTDKGGELWSVNSYIIGWTWGI